MSERTPIAKGLLTIYVVCLNPISTAQCAHSHSWPPDPSSSVPPHSVIERDHCSVLVRSEQLRSSR
jgi:hypothetical protein